MGEPEPQVVEQLDMGTQPVDQGAVSIPTEEKIVGFHIDRTTSDRKWMNFVIITDQRRMVVDPGSFTQQAFDVFCGEVLAMFQTPQGQVVLSKIRQALALRSLQVETVVRET